MAVLPATPKVLINLTTGAGFGNVLILGTGKLGQTVLGTTKPNIIDVSSNVLSIATRKERNLLQDKYLSATATVRIVDPDGNFNPQNTSSPYYPNLQPLRRIQISATYSSTNYPIGEYYITEYRYTYPKDQETGFVDLVCYDAFRLFFNSNVTTVTNGIAGQDTGTRINKILDMVAYTNSQRLIQIGQTTCVADDGTTRTVLEACQTAEFSEQGAFYIDKSGNATFKNRNFVYNAQSKTPIKFSNAPGTPDIIYSNIVFAFDDKTIVNQCSVTRVGGTTQTYTDTTSKDTFFTHSITANNMIMQTDANALSLATAYVTSRKDTTIRIDAISLNLVTLGYGPGIVAALGIDYFDTMQITNIGQAGSTIIKTLQCQGIAHDITANSWVTTFNTQEPLLDVNY